MASLGINASYVVNNYEEKHFCSQGGCNKDSSKLCRRCDSFHMPESKADSRFDAFIEGLYIAIGAR